MLRTADLDYELPKGRIATAPSDPRDAARLMVIARGGPSLGEDRVVRDLPSILSPGDLMVFNTTRVLPARIVGRRVRTGGRVEGLYVRDHHGPGLARHRGPGGDRAGEWVVMLHGRHLHAGVEIALEDGLGRDSGYMVTLVEHAGDEPGAWVARVSRPDEAAVGAAGAVLERIGLTPIPPYILKARRGTDGGSDDERDRRWYQTVYADEPAAGSIAGPTAGFHFTPELLAELDAKGVRRAGVVLHVGVGTFRPITEEVVESHAMHGEHCCMTPEVVETIRRTRAAGGRVIAVGSTAARTIETYAALVEGSAEEGRSADAGRQTLPPAPSLGEGELAGVETKLLITPGFQWRWTSGLLTNFHLPRSTLLAMVAAIIPGGIGRLKEVYAAAIEREYRFYSFGDAMLILP